MAHKVTAVHDADLEHYLERLDLLEPIKNELIVCHYCGKIITLENLLCLFPNDHEIRICCDDPNCFRKVLQDRREKSEND